MRAFLLNDKNADEKIQAYPLEQRNRIMSILNDILSYEIPAYKISEVRTYKEIANVFVRLNSGGSKLKVLRYS